MQLNYNLEMQPAVAGSLYDLSTKTVDSFSAEEAMNAGVPVIPGTAEGLVKAVATGEAAKVIGIAVFAHKQDIEGAEKYYEKGYISKVVTTNLHYRRPELLTRPYYEEADMSKFLASIIDSMNHDVSINHVQSPTEKIHKLLASYQPVK